MDEIEKREGVTLNLSTSLTSEEGLESLVGIEDGWSDDQKKKHIRTEFQKWSNRLNSLPEGDERDAAQNMLDNLSVLKENMTDLVSARALAERVEVEEDRQGKHLESHELQGRSQYKDSMLRHGLLISESVTPKIEKRISEVCDS